MKSTFEIEWPDELGTMWMNKYNLQLCIDAYCENKDGRITVADATTDKVLNGIYAPFGGQSNFEAVLKLLEQTRGKCPECKGAGTVDKSGRTYHCSVCHGSGQVVQIERLVVLAEDQSLPPQLYNASDKELDPEWVEEATKQDMLSNGWRKVLTTNNKPNII